MENDRFRRVSFRPISIEKDVELIYAWLGDPDVSRWYSEGLHDLEHYRRTFAPEPTTHKFIMRIDEQPVGYLQAYRLANEPEYAAQLGLEHDAVSIDLFIGAAAYRGQGWGSVLLRVALQEIVFGQMGADYACINPDPENIRAVRSYEKAGFRGDRIVWINDDEPHNTGYERIMVMSREDFSAISHP